MARLDSDLIGLPIVSMETAGVVAEVDALIIDDATLTVAGFLANMGLYEATILPYQAARAVGADAIVVRSEAVLAPLSSNPVLSALAEKGIEITDARIVTLTGQEVGTAGGYYVDDRGHVIGLELLGAEGTGEQEPELVPIADVHRVGPDLVVLKQEFSEHLVKDPALLDRPTPKTQSGQPAAAHGGPPAKPPRTRTRKPDTAAPVAPEAQPATAQPEAKSSRAKPRGTPAEAESPPRAGNAPPAAEVTVEPVRPLPADETGPARHFLVGRRVTRRIEDAAGEVIAEEGAIVTLEMIQRARERDQLLILSLNVE
jgi:uncharacterized protein YrrD